nr:MFS transporter [Rhizobium sp. Q54]
MQQPAQTLDIQTVIDGRPFSRYQWLIFTLCFLILATDGYDTVSIGLIAPALRQEWGVSVSALAPVVGAALAGLGLGAMIAGPLADRFGRKNILVASVAFFGMWSFASAYAWSVESMTILRLLTGLGLGAAMPNALTMMSEFAPKRRRALAVNATFSGFSVGLFFGGLAAAWLIPHYGWQSILHLGGVLPILLSVVAAIYLPESVQFLAVRNRKDPRIAQILGRIATETSFEGCSFVDSRLPGALEKVRGARHGVALILAKPFLFYSVMLWITYFMALLVYYLLASWLPTLFRDAGFTPKTAALMTSLFPLGGVVGNLCTGVLMDRFDGNKIIATAWLGAATLMVCVGYSLSAGFESTTMLGILTVLMGCLTTAGVSAMSAYAATLYPTEGRATGIAWMLGVGRFGGVAGAFGGGAILGLGLTFGSVISLLALPAALAFISLKLIAMRGAPAARLTGAAHAAALH